MKNKGEMQEISRIGRLLLQRGWIDNDSLARALSYQQKHHCLLGESLIALGIIDQKQLDKALSKQKWLRTFIASIVIVSTPMCPLLAQEKQSSRLFSEQSHLVEKDKANPNLNKFKAKMASLNDTSSYQVGIQHKFSKRAGLELMFNSDRTHTDLFNSVETIYPQLMIYTTSEPIMSEKAHLPYQLKMKPRCDRYKNTLPVVYRLTLKGYSIFEKTEHENEARFMELERDKENLYKSYELMFSVSKSF